MNNPFGDTITSDDIIEDLNFFDSWEDRYRYIIDLGKQLPPMDSTLKTNDHLIRGCQSQVWLASSLEDNKLVFYVDSDAVIVRGLLAMVLGAFNQKKPHEILDFNIEQYFNQIDLLKHLSPTRGNGLQAMIKQIKGIAKQASLTSANQC